MSRDLGLEIRVSPETAENENAIRVYLTVYRRLRINRFIRFERATEMDVEKGDRCMSGLLAENDRENEQGENGERRDMSESKNERERESEEREERRGGGGFFS